MLNIQAILMPADFSECSQAAFRVARALARDYRARLVVLHIAEPPPFVTPGSSSGHSSGGMATEPS